MTASHSHREKYIQMEHIHSKIRISPDLQDIVYLAGIEIHGIRVQEEHEGIEAALEEEAASLRERYKSPSEAKSLFEPARKLYRSLGIDPTRHRPSSESLIRRILQGKSLYRINSVVDSFNLLSVRFALPVGLYDIDHIIPPVLLRKGKPDEGYAGIGKEFVNVSGRICFVDEHGPFGNPSSDSARTRIRNSTQNVLATFFIPVSFDPTRTRHFMEEARDFLLRFHSIDDYCLFLLGSPEDRAVSTTE